MLIPHRGDSVRLCLNWFFMEQQKTNFVLVKKKRKKLKDE